MISPLLVECVNGVWIATCSSPTCKPHVVAEALTRRPVEEAADQHLKAINQARAVIEDSFARAVA